MELLASESSEAEAAEVGRMLEEACAAAGVAGWEEPSSVIASAVRVHDSMRASFLDASRCDMQPLPPDEGFDAYVDPWMADQVLPNELIAQHSVDDDALFANFPGACPFGARMKAEHFHLNPQSVFLNTGSYGAVPALVLAARQEWERLEMLDPVQWRAYIAPQLLRKVKNKLAALIRAHPADVALMINCNTATSTVLRSLPWEVGDVLLLLSCDYDATKLAARFLEETCGVTTIYIDIVLPLTDGEIVNAIDSFLGVRRRQGDAMPRLANICHVTSKTAWIFPAKRIVSVLHKYGVPVLVDGAQAPGHIHVDVTDIGADFYTGTCHKWLFGCQGTAFLAVAPGRQALLQPLAPTTGFAEPFSHAFAESMQHDWSTFLALLQAFEFVDRVCGGWSAVLRYNRQLAWAAAKELCEMWELAREGLQCVQAQQMGEAAAEGNCMPIIPLPRSRNATDADATKLMGYLLAKYAITAFLFVENFRFHDEVRSCLAVRISCNVHVCLEDVRRLGRAVRELNGSYGTLGVMKEYLPEAMTSMTS